MQRDEKKEEKLKKKETDAYYKEMEKIKIDKARKQARYDSKNIIQKVLGFLHSEN